jgi:hypothetical protein
VLYWRCLCCTRLASVFLQLLQTNIGLEYFCNINILENYSSTLEGTACAASNARQRLMLEAVKRLLKDIGGFTDIDPRQH